MDQLQLAILLAMDAQNNKLTSPVHVKYYYLLLMHFIHLLFIL
jgi:hypothetical protein